MYFLELADIYIKETYGNDNYCRLGMYYLSTRQTYKTARQMKTYDYKNPDRGFALKKEENDYFLMEDFNSCLKLKELGRCPDGYHADASGYSQNGNAVNVEIKQRNQTLSNFKIQGKTKDGRPYTADTIYIEAHKAGDMLIDYVCECKVPLYINFLNDGWVIVYNLSKLKHRPKTIAKKIWSDLYQGFELAKREELKLEDAFIYKKENNKYKLIQRP